MDEANSSPPGPPGSWRLFLPLLPWALIWLALYVPLRLLSLGWAAAPFIACIIAFRCYLLPVPLVGRRVP